MTEAGSYPDEPTILLDRSPFGGFEVEPHLCPAASGRGSWFLNFIDAREYAEALAADAGASALVLCGDPQEGEAWIGIVRDFRGQRYEVVQTFERPRRDGTTATILIWQSGCNDCGEPFTFSTPAASSKFEPNRRCAQHKRPGQRVRRGDVE